MLDFDFCNPVKILFGKGKIARLSEEIPVGERILLVYGQGSIKENGVYQQVKAALSTADLLEFSGVQPNPRFETLMEAVELVKREGVTFLLAVGGGSVLDGVKFIAAAAKFQGDPWDIVAKNAPLEDALPFGTVLTLPATGSEMNSGAVITRETTEEKLPFMSALLFPKFSILDPTTTYSLPQRQIINGIVDSFVHVVELYVSDHLNAPLQDRMAEGILLTLIEEGPKALNDRENYEVRSNIMFCAMMALNGMFSMGLPEDWEAHMLGHELTARYGIDHAATLGVLLPPVWRARVKSKREKLLKYGERIFQIREGSEDERIQRAIQATADFFQSIGMAIYLEDYQVPKSDIPLLAERFMCHKDLMMPHRPEITQKSAEAIFRDAYMEK